MSSNSKILIKTQSPNDPTKVSYEKVRYESAIDKYAIATITSIDVCHPLPNPPLYQVYISAQLMGMISVFPSPKVDYYKTMEEAEYHAQTYLNQYGFKIIDNSLSCYI